MFGDRIFLLQATENADIFLYGCNVAGDATGRELVESLSEYTTADIIASTDLTGSAELGGDWDLEYAVGEIESELAFNTEINQSYQYVLNEFLPGTDIPLFNGSVFRSLPMDVTLPGSPNAPVRVELDKFFGAPDIDLNTPVIDLPVFDPSVMSGSDFRIDYTPVDLSFINTDFDPNTPILNFPQAENQPFSLNFSNGNFSWIRGNPDYDYRDAKSNTLIFPFDASSLNFNASNFEFTSVSLNKIDPLDPDNDSITFEFQEGSFDFSSLTPRNSIAFDLDSDTYDFYDIEADQRVQVDENFVFDASGITFRSDSITFDFRPSTLNFDPSAFVANANLYDYKLNGADFEAGVSVEQFNASDYRALDYAFEGDELFDSRHYRNQGGTPDGMNPFADYIENGWRAGRNPNGLFNVNHYLDQNSDVKQFGAEPLTHYALFGGSEIFDSRDPNRLFDSSYYLAKNPDVAAAGINPLLHFIQFGWKESRFDNPAGFNPNRDPSAFFDTSFYFENNPDVESVSYQLDSANALQHFLEFGPNGSVASEESRLSHPIFTFDSQVSFTTFVDADSDSFEFFQNKINTNQFGVRTFRGDGGVKVASVFGESGIDKLIEGFFYTVIGVGAFILQKSAQGLSELGERAFEAAEDAGLFERITISPADGNIFTFPGQTEGTIVVEEFPGGEAITIDDDGIIFSTPLEPITDFSSPTVFPQRDEILDGLLNEGFIFPGDVEVPQTVLTIDNGSGGGGDTVFDLGFARELFIAESVGGRKAADPTDPTGRRDLTINEPGVSRGLAIDVFGANNELILVGGKAKRIDIRTGKFRGDILTLKRLADARGVEALAYFADNTTDETLNIAREILGTDNVITFSDPTVQDFQRLLQDYQNTLGGN